MSCGKHTTRRQAHATRRAKTSHTVRKAAHNAARQSTTNKARKATSAHVTHRQIRALRKARPKAAHAAKAPKKRTGRKLSAAQLKARNTAHRTASRRARATARAHALAKARAGAKARGSRRAAQKTARSHAKAERFYCRVNIRGSALVSQQRPPGSGWSQRPRKNPARAVKYRTPAPGRAAKGSRALRAGKK